MSRRSLASALAALAVLWSGVLPGAEPLGTADDAKAMLERAVEALKAHRAEALKAFNDEKNKQFHDRDLYVFCFSLPDGNFTAYESPVLLGTNIRELTLPPNDAIGQRAYDAVANAPEGTIVTMDYELPKPGTKKPAPKQSFEVRVGNQAGPRSPGQCRARNPPPRSARRRICGFAMLPQRSGATLHELHSFDRVCN
jgi:hypothetical protein